MRATTLNPLADPEAFSEFYERHAHAVLAFIVRRVLDPQLAMDLTAETFAQAFLSRKRFRRGGEMEALAWVHVIARRQISRYFRRGRAEGRALQRLGLDLERLSADDVAEIERMAGLIQVREAIARGFEALSEDQRSAIRLRVVEERPYKEIAQHLGVSEQTVRSRVSRGLRSLSRMLDEEPAIKEALA